MRARRSAVFCLCVVLTACAAQRPTLRVPSLAGIRRESVGSESIDLGPLELDVVRFLSHFGGGHDGHGAAATQLWRGVRSVQIRTFRFPRHDLRRRADLVALRSRFAAAGWQHLVRVRDRRKGHDVDIYCALYHHWITGLVILSVQRRSFTWVHLTGNINPDHLDGIRRHWAGPSRHANVPPSGRGQSAAVARTG